MTCFPQVRLLTVYRCLCVASLLLLLAGHLATLAYSYQSSDNHHRDGTQLLVGGAILCSALTLPLLARLLPHQAELLRRAWLAVHLTWSDDLARRAVQVLYELQVWPVVHALGLAPAAAPLDTTLDYWWWSLKGLLLVAMAGWLSRPAAEADGDGDGDGEGEDECDNVCESERVMLTEVVVVVCGEGQQWTPCHALPAAPPPYCLTLHQN